MAAPLDSGLERRFLDALKGHLARQADEALERPSDKSEFGFGYQCGFHAGLKSAEQLFEQVIGEEEDGT